MIGGGLAICIPGTLLLGVFVKDAINFEILKPLEERRLRKEREQAQGMWTKIFPMMLSSSTNR